ncbi:MFS transporter [Asaia bogorensis]|uniref:MFS transporter n=1 Tax=Asaia bogorensis NBRC 16594 TaxID=1231624 RepID=A0AAN4U2Y4_9PROT|nr:MFS transporter [Asaia bogorensis]BAT19610.1 alpha-ketoglutarate/sugar transporter [Asaia bogorensis NBRC 16594]GBQ78251.1 major facilitator superfamily alpha-ketoglutarate/sugar transporter [Asaia bogorensis NBRC 16594]GEL53892.1 MFS transporter [Asaia bogorensis NBRC 16594]
MVSLALQRNSATVAMRSPPTEANDALRPEMSAQELRRAAWTCSIGSAMEYYDFALYSLASALIFAPLFFPSNIPGLGLVASFATYFIGFAVRPLGGIFFGRLGDRYGRKRVLLLTVTLMGLASAFIGLIPTYKSIGIMAPLLLVFLRMAQGFGAGAEQAGAAVMMTECAPRKRRGYYAALPFLGIQIGTVSAGLIYYAMLTGVPDITQTMLWRVPFVGSAVLLLIALYMRMRLKESPTFAKIKEDERHEETGSLRETLTTSWRPILAGMGLRMAENGGSSIYQVLAISYLVHTIGMNSQWGTLVLIGAALVGGVTIPVAGWLSDRFGRVRVYRGFALLQAVSALPVWYVFSQGHPIPSAIALSFALGVATWGMFGTQGALLPEMFGLRHRYTAVSFTREFSSVIAGGVSPMVGQFLIAMFARFNIGGVGSGKYAWIPLSVYVVFLACLAILATFYVPETRGRDLMAQEDAL